MEWDGIYQLELSDFQSPETEIGNVSMYSVYTASVIDFAFNMSSGEFMFTKNFNSKVSCTFKRNAATIVAPDTAKALELLSFARFDFDLAELYARHFRKRMFEKKGAFSDASFFRPVYDEIQREYAARHTAAAKETEIGHDSLKLIVLHNAVKNEIEALYEFCKTCKPSKKK